MRIHLLPLLIAAATSGANLAGAMTISLGSGDNLSNAIASAQDGDVIELLSNDPFKGNLTWSNKFITIKAGDGFNPTIQGSISGVYGTSQTGGAFYGLSITGGLSASTTGTRFAKYIIEDTTIKGDLSLSGTGGFKIDMVAQDSLFQGSTAIGGTGGFSVDGIFERNAFTGTTYISTISNEQLHSVGFYENIFYGRVLSGGGSSNLSHRELTFQRNRFHRGLKLAVGTFNYLDFDVANNVFSYTRDPNAVTEIGFQLESASTFVNVTGSFVNNTIVGFDTGIDVRLEDSIYAPQLFDVRVANLLLNNTDDVDGLESTNISYSLIADGSFEGLDGNFAGQPFLDASGRLLANSPGIDRGNSALASGLDFAGNPRVVDGNGDGVAIVDVGAFEYSVPEPYSIAFVLIGVVVAAFSRWTWNWPSEPVNCG